MALNMRIGVALATVLLAQVAWAAGVASYNDSSTYGVPTLILPDKDPNIKYGPLNHVEVDLPTPVQPVLVYPTYSAMQCTGHGYCFQDQIEKVVAHPACPPGFTVSQKADKCYKQNGYLCKLSLKHNKYLTKDRTKCYVCNKDEYLNSANKCEKLCKEGYEQILINGVKWCLQRCTQGWMPFGHDCVKFSAAKTPKKCEQKYCLLPGEKLYMTGPSQGSSYDPKGPACICAKPAERKLYEKEKPVAPKLEASEAQYVWTEAKCPNGKAPNVFGKCPKVCPSGSFKTKNGSCQQACPSSMKECLGPAGQHICVTKALVFGCDACKVINAMINDCDTSIRCPMPMLVAPTKA